MAKKLILTFKNEKNTTSSFVLDNVREPVDPVKVKSAMDAVAASKIFIDNKGQYKYLIPLAAKVVNTAVDEIFNLKQK